ncbi:ABC transporter ATP-binding protein/permease [Ruminococcus albus]|uniref:ABC transporter, ATP-binding protein n=1 Tax=Ruminococcus albus 8 TaxID=246199 RepID=E9SFJ0_RUMAL|nr:ABC transporter ATP-binding protein/permease [Ruminococcus albus]EGC01967.1 ABC transporter, ATP-binding protein [Ruminococcus albus 8]MCC3349773.1 ABC transporter ATP-binding protein/permease [Ruminococcus albus 8]
MLSLKEITKNYVVGDTTVKALKGVSIDFRENEFVSILGQSGCGKTTLLNIIGGLDRYTDGDLNINGKSTKDFKDADWDSYRNHSIGFVFQSYNLIPHQTVLANVELALTLSGVPKAERRKRAIDALTQVGLGDQLSKKPNQMSGGQMQRVAIARALVNDPDILLADEPTGALDTETSVQIMEILKNISKDKLIIMVTHNPELAEKYSSRIIRLLDGKVTDDSDPYNANAVNEEKSAAEKKKERKKLKTSMNFLTALSLSRNNLMTKKARTLLTSFAGSIGIIGIALILSISNGVQVYIDQVQSDTLSTYPLTIEQTTASVGEIMSMMAEDREASRDHDMDKVYSQNQMARMINTLMQETKVNNLEKFKTFLDENKEIKTLTSDIKYGYATTLNVFKADTSEGAYQVNPSQVLMDMGYLSETQMMGMSMGGAKGSPMRGMDVWNEMIDNDDLIKSQYDIIAGRMPEKYSETVLIVDKYNEINDYILYSLGILDSSEINGIVRKAITGEEVKLNNEQHSYTYDELLDLKFKVVPTTDFYRKKDGVWEDMKDDYDYMVDVVDKGLEVSVVGILRPNDDAAATSINGGIAYKHELMEYLVNEVKDSEIVKEQQENPDIDVFSGLKFKGENDEENEQPKDTETEEPQKEEEPTAEETVTQSAPAAGMPELSDEQLAALMAGEKPEGMSDEEFTAMMAQMSAEAPAAEMPELSDEQLAALMAGQLPEGMTEEEAAAYMAQGGNKEQMQELTDMGMNAMGGLDMGSLMSGSGDFMGGLTDAQKEFLASLSDEQLAMMQGMITETTQQNLDQLANSGKFSNTTYDANMVVLGYATLENPSSINIYPKDFASKERIIELIDEYNDNAEEADEIEYTDIVGVMMSSVTSIINAISYVLIAFVAISLVVSSIMIGIITYISVLERTKEIGILRSIGASKRDISRVFNAETVIVGAVAGILGVGLSYLLTIPINAIIAHLTTVPMRAAIPYAAAGILVLISILLTLVAGLFPSRIAAKKDPVIALRTE